jgi:hypothetical protein
VQSVQSFEVEHTRPALIVTITFCLRYYLEESNGDVKAAVSLARMDDSWEHVTGNRRGLKHEIRGQA